MKPKPVVSFLGPPTTYSHQAATALFSDQDWELVPVATIKGVFDVVQSGEATYGVVPFENSTHGVVTFTLDCLGDRRGEYADVHVCGETYLDVHHFLLGRKAPTLGTAGMGEEGAPQRSKEGGEAGFAHIRHVYSHPQGLGQTARFTAAHLPHADLIDVSSTSRAAELAAADHEGRSAAVASEMAAAPNGLDILARCIEDRKDNTTRFFVIFRRGGGEVTAAAAAAPPPPPPPPLPTVRAGETAERATGESKDSQQVPAYRTKSLVSFTVPHRSPGALADALQCFRRGGLNLTSINSLPSLAHPFQYLFFVEFESSACAGHGDEHDGRSRPGRAVRAVLDDLRGATESSRWLGSWMSQR